MILVAIATGSMCHAQSREVVCNNGTGSFDAGFRTGVSVRVEAARNGELAARRCQASLSWDKQKLLVADDAAQIDVDAFGVDLGLNAPVVAFQVKKLGAPCCVDYRIYSLRKPPKLLQTLSGGDFFSAADTDLDGAVEIWTDDAASVDGFENLFLGQLDFAPTVVLRFMRGQLLDVSSEFQPYFDDEIAKIRMRLDAGDLQDFKASDGKLPAPVPFSAEALRRRDRLQTVKIKVLEIVWAYLYSGREEQAWGALAELWPPADIDRIRTAILGARNAGIRAEVHGVVTEASSHRRSHARIFDAINEKEKGKLEVIPPQPILIWRPPPLDTEGQGYLTSELLLRLVIDSAGKVRSAEPGGDPRWFDAGVKGASANWKFIPAFRGNDPVASRMGFFVSVKR